MTLPTTVANFDAQYFGKRVLELGEKALLTALSEDHAATVHDYLMACEILAASRGYPCEPSGWCYFAEEWLYASGFVASDEVANQAVERLTQSVKVPGVKKQDLRNVRARLSKRPQKVKRANPKLSLTKAKKLARSFDDNVIEGKGFYGVAPNVQQAVAIIAFREFDRLSIGFPTPPKAEQISAFKILLVGMESTIEVLDIESMLPSPYWSGDADPHRILKQSELQISKLTNLEHAFVENLHVDDDVIRCICSSPNSPLKKSCMALRYERWNILAIGGLFDGTRQTEAGTSGRVVCRQ